MGLLCLGLPSDEPTYNLNHLIVTPEQYKYIKCGIKKKGMKTNYDNVLKDRTHCSAIPKLEIEELRPETWGYYAGWSGSWGVETAHSRSYKME